MFSEGANLTPCVDLAFLIQASDIFGSEVIVDDLALGVALEFLTDKLSRRHIAKVHLGVVVEEIDQGLASVTAGANEANSRRHLVGSILLAQRRVRVRVESISEMMSGGGNGARVDDVGSSSEGGLGHRGDGEGSGAGGYTASADANGPESSRHDDSENVGKPN